MADVEAIIQPSMRVLPPEPVTGAYPLKESNDVKASLTIGPVWRRLGDVVEAPPMAPSPDSSDAGPFQNLDRSRLRYP